MHYHVQYEHCMWPRYPSDGGFISGRSRALRAVNRLTQNVVFENGENKKK